MKRPHSESRLACDEARAARLFTDDRLIVAVEKALTAFSIQPARNMIEFEVG